MQLFKVGKIKKTHGFKGDLIAYLDYDFDKSELKEIAWYLNTDGAFIPYMPERIGMKNDGAVIVKFVNLSAEQVKNVLGSEVQFNTNDIALPEVEGFELEGFEVFDNEKGLLGIIKEIIGNDHQETLVIKHKSGKEILIPYVDEIVVEVLEETKRINVILPDGLLELYL